MTKLAKKSLVMVMFIAAVLMVFMTSSAYAATKTMQEGFIGNNGDVAKVGSGYYFLEVTPGYNKVYYSASKDLSKPVLIKEVYNGDAMKEAILNYGFSIYSNDVVTAIKFDDPASRDNDTYIPTTTKLYQFDVASKETKLVKSFDKKEVRYVEVADIYNKTIVTEQSDGHWFLVFYSNGKATKTINDYQTVNEHRHGACRYLYLQKTGSSAVKVYDIKNATYKTLIKKFDPYKDAVFPTSTKVYYSTSDSSIVSKGKMAVYGASASGADKKKIKTVTVNDGRVAKVTSSYIYYSMSDGQKWGVTYFKRYSISKKTTKKYASYEDFAAAAKL